MDMTGSRRIEAPRARVWDALNDPDALKAAIPGAESVERTGPDSFAAKVAVRIGPMAAKFGGKVTLTNVVPPASYTITGEGSGGALGFARGGADVALEEEGPDATVLTYTVKAQVGGKMAQLGARLVDSTARQMADQFFDRFAAALAPAEPVAATDMPASVVVGRAAASDTVPTVAPDAARPVDTGRTATAELRPASIMGTIGAMIMRIPPEILGLPITFWLGSGVMAVILLLLFVVG